MEKGKIIKYIRNLIIFILLIILTFWMIFKDQSGDVLIDILKNANWKYILYGCLIMVTFFCIEALNIGRMLKYLGEKSTFRRNLKYAFVGFFFSAITPASSGGQPMQMYYMHKDGISIGSSSLTLLINLSCFLLVTVTLSFVSLIFNYQYMNTGLWLFFAYGTIVNSAAVSLFLIAVFSERTLNKIIVFAKSLLKRHTFRRMRKVKNGQSKNKKKLITKIRNKYEKRLNKVEEYACKYRENSLLIKKDIRIVLKTLFVYYIQYILFFTVSYCAYLAAPIKEHIHSWFDIASLQSLFFAIVSGVPLPGAVGVSEATYMELFKNVISPDLVSTVMLLARTMSFYLFVLVGGIVVLFAMYKVSKINKHKDSNKDAE